MKNEIKEILDYLKDEDEYYKKAEEVIVGYGDLIVEKEDIDKLLDYITNLQEKNKILQEALYLIWGKEIDINYVELQKAVKDIKNMKKEADKELSNGLHKMIFGSDKE